MNAPRLPSSLRAHHRFSPCGSLLSRSLPEIRLLGELAESGAKVLTSQVTPYDSPALISPSFELLTSLGLLSYLHLRNFRKPAASAPCISSPCAPGTCPAAQPPGPACSLHSGATFSMPGADISNCQFHRQSLLPWLFNERP